MSTGKANVYWTLIVVLLIVIIAVGGASVWSKYRGRQPIEISMPAVPELSGEIYVGGAVNNPGFYPLKQGDSLESLIQAAGGMTGSADLNRVNLYIPRLREGEPSQRIDINRAEVWLLMALPGIGEVKAEAIVEYRRQNGPFRHTNELVKVEGIGATIYERVRDLITVAD